MAMSRAVASCTDAKAQQRDDTRRREVGRICMHAPGLVATPFPSAAPVVGQCKLQAEVHERAQRGTPPPLTVEARSQSRVGLRAAVVIGQGDG